MTPLNRVTSAAFKLGGVTDQTITYAYDAGTNQKGHLTGASDANHSMSWSYDAQGRVTGKGQTIGGVTFDRLRLQRRRAARGTVLPSGAHDYATATTPTAKSTSLTLNGSHHDPERHHLRSLRPDHGLDLGQWHGRHRAFDTDGKITQIDKRAAPASRTTPTTMRSASPASPMPPTAR